jgi:hypothetical protein
MTVIINGTTGISTPGVTNSSTTTNTGNVTNSGTVTNASTISVGNATPAGSGAGITFPASFNPSSDANTLDDYEEGTWTPTIASTGTQPTVSSYDSRIGTYTKIGNTVTVNCFIRANISNAGTGVPAISGMPFTGGAAGGLYSPAVGLNNLLSARPNPYIGAESRAILDATTWVTAQNNYICFTAAYYV